MNLIPNILGYHSNEETKVLNFVNNKLPIFSEDTHWLGYGMYFWDNYTNSLYWKNEKERKNNNTIPILIAKANIITESNLLDLTDYKHVELIDTIWMEYLNNLDSKSKKKLKEYPLGKRIDFLFKTFLLLEQQYKVIKCFGKYKNSLSSFNIISNNRITNEVKTIYCVRNKDLILNATLIENN